LLILAAFLLSGSAFAQLAPKFMPPVNLGPKVNTSDYEEDPFLTYDGKKLYFVRDGDIWYSSWTDTGWTNPKELGPKINGGPTGEYSPSVSPDEKKLYFVDDARAGYNWDVWVSTWDSLANDWGNPVNLGPPVNTQFVESAAKIGADGQRLYFLSGCGVVYVSQWNGSSWSTPQVLVSDCGAGANYPSITADGSWLYYDHYVNDGISTFVRHWMGSAWGTEVDLRPQIGERSGTPSVVASGDSLFFGTSVLPGFGAGDIWLMQRIVPPKVPTMDKRFLLLLIFILAAAGVFWIKVTNS
jgi:uncharacterized protein YfiM (DUF2279 family)